MYISDSRAIHSVERVAKEVIVSNYPQVAGNPVDLELNNFFNKVHGQWSRATKKLSSFD